MVTDVSSVLAKGQWGLVEAGTGTGKSRIIAHLAAHVLTLRDAGHPFEQTPLELAEQVARAYAPGSPAGRAVEAWRARQDQSEPEQLARAVIVCAPTLANVMHLVLEYERVAATLDPLGKWRLGVVLGRGQFVSRSALEELLAAQAEPDVAVQAWLNAGCPAGATDTSQLLARLYPGICGLAEDLRELATTFPCDDALLTAQCPGEEQEWYQGLRDMAQGCDIVAVTHAMLSIDNRSIHQDRATLLPRALALFVDEAHALEATQANSASTALSLSLLKTTLRNPVWAQVRAATHAKKALSAADAVFNDLRAIPQPLKLPLDDAAHRCSRSWVLAKQSLGELAQALKALLKSAEKRSGPGTGARQVAEVQTALAAIAAVQRGLPGSLSFSQAARYPQLLVGPRTVDGPLATRWESTPCGALFSGTLLYPNPQVTARRLALPAARVAKPVEVHPDWIVNTPTLYTPADAAVAAMTPPSGTQQDAVALGAWLDQVAQLIATEVAPSAVGGTLVLLTGYERLLMLEERLKKVLPPEMAERVIAQQQVLLPMTQAMREFKRQALAGTRPIWLALGGAWTGIDLRDERFSDAEAGRDNLLTDLVIPALPFGLNRTSTHEARVNFSGFQAETVEALNTFRQGVGRLVRRQGLLNRRLWVLDGRVRNASFSDFSKTLARYQKRQHFQLPAMAAPAATAAGVFTEGAMRSGHETGYERSQAARRACLAHHGYGCAACGFVFRDGYGERGRDYIHVHHLNPLADLKGEHEVDPVRDMRPLCPNCHAMVHRTSPPCSIEELKAILSGGEPAKAAAS